MQGNQAWFLASDGGLSQLKPEIQSHLTYRYDPNNPVPSIGGEIYGEGDDHVDGSYDQRKLHNRADVNVFTSEPFAQDTTLFGMTDIGLSVSSDQPDTDFTVKINEVFPDGRSFNLGNTILRMRYRDGIEQEVFMSPREIYHVQFPPIMLSRIVKAGHKIQVEVSSSNFPSYARNLNTANNPYTSTEVRIATNTIHLGAQHDSYIRLPVVKH
jgi:putative CocE/NonD family hydrolase